MWFKVLQVDRTTHDLGHFTTPSVSASFVCEMGMIMSKSIVRTELEMHGKFLS